MSVNKENMKKWVDALRSGDYKQASGTLRRIGYDGDNVVVKGMCCLGVACDVSGLGEWKSKAEEGITSKADDTTSNYVIPTCSASDAYLPSLVKDWLFGDEVDKVDRDPMLTVTAEEIEKNQIGLRHRYGDDNNRVKAAILNDNYDYTFEQIADVVERNFL